MHKIVRKIFCFTINFYFTSNNELWSLSGHTALYNNVMINLFAF